MKLKVYFENKKIRGQFLLYINDRNCNRYFKFFNCAISFDYIKIVVVLQLSNVRKCIFDNFNETVPKNKIIESQSVIDDMILKINENEIGNIVDKIYDLR